MAVCSDTYMAALDRIATLEAQLEAVKAAFGEPVAYSIGNHDGTVNRLGAVYNSTGRWMDDLS